MLHNCVNIFNSIILNECVTGHTTQIKEKNVHSENPSFIEINHVNKM